MEATLKDKALRGIEMFLTRRGMEIIEKGWAHGKDKIDFIADDNGELVFIDCRIRRNEGDGLGPEKASRKKFERIAAAYLADHPHIPEGAVRFDCVNMLIIGDTKALIRHHINALSADGYDLG